MTSGLLVLSRNRLLEPGARLPIFPDNTRSRGGRFMVEACLVRSMTRMWNRQQTLGRHVLGNGLGRRWRWQLSLAVCH
jgi:hypothetical protein